MKKRILTALLACVMCVGLFSTAFAGRYDSSDTSSGIQVGTGGTLDTGTRPPSGGSGTVSVPRNDVNVNRAPGGSVSVTPSNAQAGVTVFITATPHDGYQVESVTVKDAQGNDVTVTLMADGRYAFSMPNSQVSVDVSFKAIVVVPVNPFVDVRLGDYYYDAVLWAVENGITNGTSATQFSPNLTCTRAQTVTFLWRAAGSPAPVSASNPFTDVQPGAYYYDAVLWAVENGVTNGTSATQFSPDATVTRGQTVTFMFRAAKAQAAAGSSVFVDVETGEYYADAVQWAVNKGITNGTSTTTFGPNEGCTRGQIVTFLYRAK